jgi:hypothetical protein
MHHHGALCSERWHQQSASPQDIIHSVSHLPGTVETGIHPWGAHFYGVQVCICPLTSVTMPNCSQVKTLVRTTSTHMSFPEMVSSSLCRNHPAGEEAGCGGPVLAWLHMVFGCWGGLDILPNSLKCRWRTAYGREINNQYELHTAWKLETSVALCCDKTAYFSGLLMSPALGAPV